MAKKRKDYTSNIRRNKNLRKRFIRKNRPFSNLPGRKPWWVFFHEHNLEFLLAVLLLTGVICIIVMGHKLRNDDVANLTVNELADEWKYIWETEYPSGYKIIYYDDPRLIESDYDSLPPGLKIDWGKSGIYLIQADELSKRDASIKVDLKGVYFRPEHVSNASYSVQMLRQANAKATLAEWEDYNLVVELLEDYGDKAVILIGLKGKGWL